MNINIDLLSMVHHLKKWYEKSFSHIQEKEKLTQIEIDILLFLANNPQYDTAKEIVKIRGLAKSHVSGGVEKLIKKGFLIRNGDKEDRRCIHLKLLKAASGVVKEAQLTQKKFFEQLYQGITPEEREVWHQILMRMEENVNHALSEKKEE